VSPFWNPFNALEEFIREQLINLVLWQAEGLFDTVNNTLENAGDMIGSTPAELADGAGWDMVTDIAFAAGSTIQVVAGLLLSFFIALELVQMVIEKNNLADIDMVSVIIKWIVKSAIAIVIVSNAHILVGAIFELGQDLVLGSVADAIAHVGYDPDLTELTEQLQEVNLYLLYGLFTNLLLINITMPLISIVIFIAIMGRFIEIFMYIAAAPIPLATMVNAEYRAMGNNYIKTLAALAFQGVLMIVVLAVGGALITATITGFEADGLINDWISLGTRYWAILGYLILMCICLLKAGSVSKSLFNAT
jgi:hypothetical protein